MNVLIFLIVFPLIIALALLFIKNDKARGVTVYIGAAVIAAMSIFTVIKFYGKEAVQFAAENHWVNYAMIGIEITLAAIIICLGIKYKKYLVCILAMAQTVLLVWFEFGPGHGIAVANNFFMDNLSIIMVLIIGIIGSLICVYAVGYMKDFQKHHKDDKDRRPFFFFLLFVFLSAMFGIVMSNNLLWLYFFWEITTLCSFFLIGYTKTKEAIRNSFRALAMNLAGGVSFVIAIITLGITLKTLELSQMLLYNMMGISVILPAMFLAFAGITKAAQMPFNSWLLGAMVAPTPTSALLHSSTMVKAGVFIIIKISPALGGNVVGLMVFLVGGITFLMASFAAISQSNGKKVLAYSTVANLGLIVACGGVGTAAAVWAGIMLIIFHAVTKSLLFLCVGTAEHTIGSKDIEDMDGLFNKMPKLASYMMIGIAGMFLAPLGMLVAKWATMTSFIDSGQLMLIMVICFGSAATVFYWTKWMGKLSAIVAGEDRIDQNVNRDEKVVHFVLVFLTVIVCITFPLISNTVVLPYLFTSFGALETLPLTSNQMAIFIIMIVFLILMFALLFGRTNKKIVPIYLSGVNKGDDLTFEDSMHNGTKVSLRNWHMESHFGEKKMNLIGCIAASVAIIIPMTLMLIILLGGAQ